MQVWKKEGLVKNGAKQFISEANTSKGIIQLTDREKWFGDDFLIPKAKM